MKFDAKVWNHHLHAVHLYGRMVRDLLLASAIHAMGVSALFPSTSK